MACTVNCIDPNQTARLPRLPGSGQKSRFVGHGDRQYKYVAAIVSVYDRSQLKGEGT
jgi:hypothetical protein